jgi:hypothetical protein
VRSPPPLSSQRSPAPLASMKSMLRHPGAFFVVYHGERLAGQPRNPRFTIPETM